ncbi:MAG: cytochrome c3 family protein, partial [Candidatus Hydrogenedentota bacterium]
MAPVFPPGANALVRWSIVGGALLVVAVASLASALYYSPVVTNVNIAKEQPIPFSHQRHVSGNGIDCRYCHTTVETSNFAGIPPTETCMTCHSQILTDQPMFAPILESWQTGKSMEWTRLNDLPDFVYFNHSIHISKGIGCNHCHSNGVAKIEE